jgi:DtxR family Mn-dependent transcriptional regulator
MGNLTDVHPAGEFHPAFEEYCERIYELREDNVELIQARIAERLDVSRASVSEMIKRMTEEGLVAASGASGSRIQLTAPGLALAERVVRRHRLAERFLIDVLGLPWSTSHHEACKWEHVMSDEVEAAMTRMLGAPTTCPHGNPIPRSGYEPPETVALAQVPVGATFAVSRIPEELEEVNGMLDFLEQRRLVPGARGSVVRTTGDGDVTVRTDREVEVHAFASRRILVTTS